MTDFASILADYDREPADPTPASAPLHTSVRHNAAKAIGVHGGTALALDPPIAFGFRDEYWYHPQRRVFVAYAAREWRHTGTDSPATRAALLHAVHYLDRWYATVEPKAAGVDYSNVGGWRKLARRMAEALREMPEPPTWPAVVASQERRHLPATMAAHLREFLADEASVDIDDAEPRFGERLAFFGYCGARDIADLLRRQRFFYGYANALASSNAYMSAGSQFFAPILQNTRTDVFTTALAAWRRGDRPDAAGLKVLDGNTDEPRDIGHVNIVSEIWGVLNAHRAPFYNRRAEGYRELLGDPDGPDDGGVTLIQRMGERTRAWLSAQPDAHARCLEIFRRDVVAAPFASLYAFEARKRRVPRRPAEFSPGAIDLSLSDELTRRAREHYETLTPLDQAAAALHLVLDGYIYRQSIEDDEETDEPTYPIQLDTGASPAHDGAASPLAAAINAPRMWLYAPGGGAEFWEHDRRDGIAAIGWDELGDLRDYATRDTLSDGIVEHYEPEGRPVNNVMSCWNFAHEIQLGDTIVVKRGRQRVIGLGRVVGPYRFDDSRPRFKHVLDVQWLWSGDLQLDFSLPLKTLTNVSRAQELRQRLRSIVGESAAEAEPEALTGPGEPEAPPYTLDDAMADLFMGRAQLERLVELLHRKQNLVLQGPPGVGKTFTAQRLAYLLMGEQDDRRLRFVQFHQAYTYEGFVRGLRPDTSGSFTLHPGPFFALVAQARIAEEDAHVLIIDEINRGNLAKILGELMMLIEPDKRKPSWAVDLPHSSPGDPKFFVPPNVYIIGTMNTADRSLALVDYALRRRFVFVDLAPEVEGDSFATFLGTKGLDRSTVARITRLVSGINRLISADAQLGRGFMIGHSYFCEPPPTNHGAWLDDVIRYELLPLLEEYWFDAPERLAQARELMTSGPAAQG
jgi:5-methylcytosine-specific restriction protein B